MRDEARAALCRGTLTGIDIEQVRAARERLVALQCTIPPPWRRHPSRCVPTYWQGYSLGRLCGLLWVSQRLAELGKGDEHPVY